MATLSGPLLKVAEDQIIRICEAFRLVVILALTCTLSLGGCQTFRYWSPPAPSESRQYGEYLAAHMAGLNQNIDQAALYWERVWLREKHNPIVLERAAQACLISGDIDRAQRLAIQADPSVLAQAPSLRLLLLVTGFKRESMRELQALFASEPKLDSSYGAAIDMLLEWKNVWHGRKVQPSDSSELKGQFWLYHKGFLHQAAGQDASALLLFEQLWKTGGRFPMGARAYAELLAKSGRQDEAIKLVQSFDGELGAAPMARRLARNIAAGGAVESVSLTPLQGAALALTIPALSPLNLIVSEERGKAIILLRLALELAPQFDLARIRLAELLMLAQMPDAALAELDKMDPESAWHSVAQLREAGILLQLDRLDEATQVAKSVKPSVQGRYQLYELGRILAALQHYKQAETVFSQVIAIDRRAKRENGQIWFARGQMRERQGKWDLAEADLQKALELMPNRPDILNYLGYSWLDRGENIDNAFALIRKAAAARPDSGAIIDSLGWAYFRLGRYDQAVEQLEAASVLEPADPVVSDHLGDAYWRVGRFKEARFQWQKALDLEPEPALRASLDKKLKFGLDETAPPKPVLQP